MGKTNKLPYKVTPSSDNKLVSILLNGNLSIDRMEAVRIMLSQNLERYPKFHLKLDDVESIDLGMIQLLYSFKWTAEQKSKSVAIDFNLQDDQKQLLEHAGFAELINGNQ